MHGFREGGTHSGASESSWDIVKARRAKSKHSRLADGREREISGLGRAGPHRFHFIYFISDCLCRTIYRHGCVFSETFPEVGASSVDNYVSRRRI